MADVATMPMSRPLTLEDFEAIRDVEDGHRYELIDGSLIVTPAPVTAHQLCVVNLTVALHKACPAALAVLTAPYDVRLGGDTVLQPDVLIARRSDLTARNLPASPLLAVEVLSPSTRLIDLNLKRARYEAAGCPSFWVIDPNPADGISLRAWQLDGTSYGATVEVGADETFTTDHPFPVSFVPSDLPA